MRNIETGQVRRVTRTIHAYAHLVGWTEDSVQRVLEGRDPTLVSLEERRDTGAHQPAPAPNPHGVLTDPSELEIWEMHTIPPEGKADLIATLRAKRAIADLQQRLTAAEEEVAQLRAQLNPEGEPPLE